MLPPASGSSRKSHKGGLQIGDFPKPWGGGGFFHLLHKGGCASWAPPYVWATGLPLVVISSYKYSVYHIWLVIFRVTQFDLWKSSTCPHATVTYRSHTGGNLGVQISDNKLNYTHKSIQYSLPQKKVYTWIKAEYSKVSGTEEVGVMGVMHPLLSICPSSVLSTWFISFGGAGLSHSHVQHLGLANFRSGLLP